MSLRKQLAVFSLLSLVLPWAGYRYVREMESVLRDGLERSLVERAATVAGALERQAWTNELLNTPVPDSNSPDVFARELTAAPVVDGSRADWSLNDAHAVEVSEDVRYWSGVYGPSLYVVVDVRDDAIVFQSRPGEPPYGDRIVLRYGDDSAAWRVFATAAPGIVRARQTTAPLLAAAGSFDDRIQAAWLATQSGYSVEMRLPLSLAGGALGIGVVDVDPTVSVDSASSRFGVDLTSTWDPVTNRAGRLVRQSSALGVALRQFADTQNRYSVVDKDGWIRATAGSIEGSRVATSTRSLTGDLLRYLLQTDDPDYVGLESPPGRIALQSVFRARSDSDVRWYRGDFADSSRVVARVPLHAEGVQAGSLLLEQASDSVLTATNQAVTRLLATTFFASIVALAGMLGFATYLSVRVSRLARAAGQALGPRGQIRTRLPGHHAGDEIGALARSFERLLERLNEYTSYLRTLTSKLSHELRTPLAVVSTSLDNLEQAPEARGEEYLKRLREGTNRLDAILGAMSEATRMEQAIRDASATSFDAVEVVRSCANSYSDVYSDFDISVAGVSSPAYIHGSPELLAQLLDKLVDNAASFSDPGGPIDIAIAEAKDALRISIANKGPLLPPQMRDQLFDSLVSVRDEGNRRPHLGLGLYVARLIAEYHGGTIGAQNLPEEDGVEFWLELPLVSPP